MVNKSIQDMPFVVNKSFAMNHETELYGLGVSKSSKSKVNFKERENALWRLNKGLSLNFSQLKLLNNLGNTALRICIDKYFIAMGQSRRSGKMISVDGKDFQKYYDENCVN
jgi:hypothetical protein